MHDLDHAAARLRRFNRFYTREIGVLREGLLDSPFSLAEVRLLYEIAHLRDLTAVQLCRDLGMDAGYVSRLLSRLRKRGLVASVRSDSDRREVQLSLTARGRQEFAVLDRRSQEEMRVKLGPLSVGDRQTLIQAVERVEGLLARRASAPSPYVLRLHQAGDMGWVVYRHAVLYAEEYGWDNTFEALVAEIVAEFIRQHDPQRERCWIAERDGDRVGSVFLVRKTDHVAKLRLLLVEPSARGLGLGRHLVNECVQFARSAGYRKITLWTNSVLLAARKIYEQAGFQLVAREKHRSFGKDLVGETWELALRATASRSR